jgi:hypothetical protein
MKSELLTALALALFPVASNATPAWLTKMSWTLPERIPDGNRLLVANGSDKVYDIGGRLFSQACIKVTPASSLRKGERNPEFYLVAVSGKTCMRTSGRILFSTVGGSGVSARPAAANPEDDRLLEYLCLKLFNAERAAVGKAPHESR